jgi:hypothetical protein
VVVKKGRCAYNWFKQVLKHYQNEDTFWCHNFPDWITTWVVTNRHCRRGLKFHARWRTPSMYKKGWWPVFWIGKILLIQQCLQFCD